MALEEDFIKQRPFSVVSLPEAWGSDQVPLRNYLPVIGALLLLVFGNSVWAQGAFVLTVGVALWKKPPRYALSRQVDMFSVFAVLIVLLTFLPRFIYGLIPLRWFRQGRWRTQVDQLDLGTSSLYTPQPWLSLEWLILLAAALAAVALLVHLPQNIAQRWRWALATALGLGVLGLLGTLGSWNPLAQDEAALVPALAWAHFPNFGTAMAIGSVLSFALLCCALKERWVLGVLLLTAALAGCALGVSTSASGMWSWALLGGLLWVAVSAVNNKRLHGIIRTAAVLLCVAAAALIFFGHRQGSSWLLNDDTGSARTVRYYDSATIVLQQSAMGVGLGNYPYVFPFYQRRSIDQGEILQPGNDWLWVVTEMGVIGLSVIALIGCALIMTQFGKGSRRSIPVRVAAFATLAMIAVGTLLQSPMHYLGTVALAIVCLNIGRYRNDERRKTIYPKWLWQAQGVVLAVIGLMWICASLFNLPWQSQQANRISQKGIIQGIETGDIATIDKSARAGMRFTPMAWRPYLERGRAYIQLSQDLNIGKNDFERTLLLVPQWAEIPYQQGVIWLPHSTQEAERSFRQAIERHSGNPERLYRDIVRAAAPDPYFNASLARISESNDRIRFAYLIGVTLPPFNNGLAAELRKDAALTRFTTAERRQLIERWVQEGNARNAIQFLERHPDIVPDTWYLRSLALARTGSFKEAADLLQNSLPMAQIPAIHTSASMRLEMPVAGFTLPAPQSAQNAATAADSDESANRLELASRLQQQLDNGNWEQALAIADRLLNMPDAPAYAYYWSAWLQHRAGDSRASWPLWEQYARHYMHRSWQLEAARERGQSDLDVSLSTQAFERWGTLDSVAPDQPQDATQSLIDPIIRQQQ